MKLSLLPPVGPHWTVGTGKGLLSPEMLRLDHTPECEVLLIRKAQPDAALTDIESEFKSLAIPFVDEAVAPARQLPYRG